MESDEVKKAIASYIRKYDKRPTCVSCGKSIRAEDKVECSKDRTYTFIHTECYRKEIKWKATK